MRGYVKDSTHDWELPVSADDLRQALAAHAGRAATKSLQFQKDRTSLPGVGRVYVYTFPALAVCRSHFDNIMGLTTKWTD
jgi:hypothetical protein